MTLQKNGAIDNAKGRRSGDGSYVFDNAGTQTPSRFSAIATIFDPGTVRHLAKIGVGNGWSCLEVGGGGGSIASWLCDKVGAAGHVVATDIDTRFLEMLSKNNLEIRRHNVAFDPLPEAAFDLVHTRLVLVHLLEREKVLTHLAAALKPGGWILAEEFDSLSIRSDLAVNPVEAPFKAFVAMQRVMVDRGVDLRYGRLLAGRLRARDLVDVAAEGRMFMWQGGSAGADLFRANIEQLRDDIIATGLVSDSELEQDLARLDDEDFLAPSPVMWAAWGRRPARTTPGQRG